jgi:large repetitive protein
MPSVAGTVNVTQTSGDYGPIFNDGEGGTTDISGIQYNFFFGDAAQNVIGDVQSVQNVLVNPITELVSSVSDNSIKTFIISSNSGAEFGLNSFLTQDGEQVDANWTATGYRAGVAVATFNYTIPQSGDVDATINLPGTFGDVDKVVVTAQGGLDGDGIDFTGFNHFVFADPPDTTPPTVTVTVANTALIAGQTSAVTFTFSEAVTGFTNADLVIANGALSNVTSSDGITFTATLTPTAGITDATNTIAVNMTGVQDQSANVGVGATNSNNYAIDTAPPTSSIVVANTALTAGATSLVTIHFSEAVTGLTLGDLTTDHGALSGLSTSDNITFTATLTPTAGFTGATNHIVLDDTGVTDAAGNLGVGTTNSNNYAIDTAPPTAGIVVSHTPLEIGETSPVTITFSEAVNGFTNSDLTVDHGLLSAVTSIDGGITWHATLTPTAGLTDATNLITLNDAGVTDAAGNFGVGTSMSNNYAIDTTTLPPTLTPRR